MKKILKKMLVLFIIIAALSACGGGNASSTADSGTTNDQTDPTTDPSTTAPVFTRKPVEVPSSILKLTDDSIYFVIIDGTKFNLVNVTVQDFLNAGFKLAYQSESADRIIEPQKRAAVGFILLTKGKNDQTINISVKNTKETALPLKDCKVTGLQFGTSTDFDNSNSSGLDIAVVGNLSIASTEEDVLSVFGTNYWALMYNSELTYEGDSKGFSFKKDASGNVANIELYYGGLYN